MTIKEQLQLITICKGKAPENALSMLDKMMFSTPDTDAPILDNKGNTRDFYLYVPASGWVPCTSGIYLVREDSSIESAIEILENTGWAEKAERDHYAIILPNPTSDGWNTQNTSDKPDDYEFLHTVLNQGSSEFLLGGKVHRTSKYMAGFGDGATMAAGCCMQYGDMIAGLFLNEPQTPPAALSGIAPVPVWLVNASQEIQSYFKSLNIREEFPYQQFTAGNKTLYEKAWDELFHGLRRWPVQGTGIVLHKSTVEEMGLQPFSNTPLGDNDNLPHDWFEYVPDIHKTLPDKKLPLLFLLHGGGTSAKYAAEQNRWHELAEKYGFFVVYPQASANSVWNAGCDTRLANDEEYLLKLFEHLCSKYPIDLSRVYCAGFSMGSLMTQCMGMLHFDMFAAIAPFSGYMFDEYWNGPETTATQPYALTEKRQNKLAAMQGKSNTLPVIQFYGTADKTWNEDVGQITRDFWSEWNATSKINIAGEPDSLWGTDSRFSIYNGLTQNDTCLYRFVTVKDLPHSVDLREPYLAWDFMSQFSRDEQLGEISIN